MAEATLQFPSMPTFDSPEEERQHRKVRLAAGFRLFSKAGFDEGVAGHITARDPEHTDTFWVNPFGLHFSLVKASDLIRVDHNGEVVEGSWPVNRAAFAIHAQVHQARPDAVAAAHSHSVHGKALSALGTTLAPITQDVCAFYDDHALFDDFTGVVLDVEEAKRIAHTLGGNKAVILRNHGLLTVGETVDSAVWWFMTMERSCQAQLLAMAAGKLVPITSGERRDHLHPGRQRVRRLVPVPADVRAHRARTTRPAGLREPVPRRCPDGQRASHARRPATDTSLRLATGHQPGSGGAEPGTDGQYRTRAPAASPARPPVGLSSNTTAWAGAKPSACRGFFVRLGIGLAARHLVAGDAHRERNVRAFRPVRRLPGPGRNWTPGPAARRPPPLRPANLGRRASAARPP